MGIDRRRRLDEGAGDALVLVEPGRHRLMVAIDGHPVVDGQVRQVPGRFLPPCLDALLARAEERPSPGSGLGQRLLEGRGVARRAADLGAVYPQLGMRVRNDDELRGKVGWVLGSGGHFNELPESAADPRCSLHGTDVRMKKEVIINSGECIFSPASMIMIRRSAPEYKISGHGSTIHEPGTASSDIHPSDICRNRYVRTQQYVEKD